MRGIAELREFRLYGFEHGMLEEFKEEFGGKIVRPGMRINDLAMFFGGEVLKFKHEFCPLP